MKLKSRSSVGAPEGISSSSGRGLSCDRKSSVDQLDHKVFTCIHTYIVSVNVTCQLQLHFLQYYSHRLWTRENTVSDTHTHTHVTHTLHKCYTHTHVAYRLHIGYVSDVTVSFVICNTSQFVSFALRRIVSGSLNIIVTVELQLDYCLLLSIVLFYLSHFLYRFIWSIFTACFWCKLSENSGKLVFLKN